LILSVYTAFSPAPVVPRRFCPGQPPVPLCCCPPRSRRFFRKYALFLARAVFLVDPQFPPTPPPLLLFFSPKLACCRPPPSRDFFQQFFFRLPVFNGRCVLKLWLLFGASPQCHFTRGPFYAPPPWLLAPGCIFTEDLFLSPSPFWKNSVSWSQTLRLLSPPALALHGLWVEVFGGSFPTVLNIVFSLNPIFTYHIYTPVVLPHQQHLSGF